MTKLRLSDGPDLLSVQQAAEATGLSDWLIRKAIREERLAAFLPGGKTDPLRAGRGTGYRIHRDELERWFFGRQPVDEKTA